MEPGTWQLRALPVGFPTPEDIVFTSQSVGYLRSGNNRMAKTTDGGVTWLKLAAAPLSTSEFGNSFSFADDNNGYVISGYKLFKTNDGGNQWSPVSFSYSVASVYAVNQNVAYIGASYNLYRTSNGGQTWEAVNYLDAKFMHFKNADEGLFFADYSEVYKTSNGGMAVSNVYNSKFTFSWQRVSLSGEFGCAIGGDNAIVTTMDGGNSWRLNQIRPQHGELRDVHFNSSQEGFIVGEDRGMIRTDDNALSWYYDENHFERDDLYQIAFSHLDTGIFVVTNNYAYTTYDGGETMFFNDWIVPIVGHLQSNDYEMVNSKVVYTVGGKVKIAKSIDGGKSWSPFSFSFSNILTAIKCLDANTCHAVGGVGMLVSTWDGGGHWKVNDLPTNSDLHEVFLLNGEVGFIGGSQGLILRTTNGGQTWNVLSTSAQWPVIAFHFLTSEKGYAVTEGGEVLRTDNSGMSWTLKQGTDIPGGSYYTFAKTFMRDTTHIYGITQGSIFRWTPPPPEPTVVTAIELPIQKILIYPNPTSDLVHFNFPDQIEGIKVMDSHGIVLRKYEAHTSEIDVADLSPGIYIVQVILPLDIQVNKIIKR
jgi:photosystem II stability/assembly factor-like uncharacterized protein